MENNLTLKQALAKIEELEKRIQALEQRPVYVPVHRTTPISQPTPQMPHYPYDPFQPMINNTKNTL